MIAPTRANPSSISRSGSDTAVLLRRRYLHHYEQRNDCWSCRSWKGYDNSVQPGESRHTNHPSHHQCSELRILQHCDQDIWFFQTNNNNNSDVIVILIHHLQHFDTITTGCNITVKYGIGKTLSESSTSENLHVLREFNAVRLSPSS